MSSKTARSTNTNQAAPHGHWAHKPLILYGNIKHAKPAHCIWKSKSKDLLTSQETPRAAIKACWIEDKPLSMFLLSPIEKKCLLPATYLHPETLNIASEPRAARLFLRLQRFKYANQEVIFNPISFGNLDWTGKEQQPLPGTQCHDSNLSAIFFY